MGGITFISSSVFGDWENFLISELIPFVDREYRTVQDWRARGLMGWSGGGYSVLILPLLHPNVWGAVGTNDACLWLGCSFANVPKGDLLDVYITMPDGDLLDVYTKAAGAKDILEVLGVRASIQIGTAASPNPDVAIGFDWPRTPDIREKWDAYCPMRRETISQHRETLNNLLEIVLIVPEDSGCRVDSLELIRQMEAEGISVTRLDWPGDHGGFRTERFIALAERILGAMEGAEASVSPHGELASLWGEVKQGR
jgi:hypothetical protein